MLPKDAILPAEYLGAKAAGKIESKGPLRKDLLMVGRSLEKE